MHNALTFQSCKGFQLVLELTKARLPEGPTSTIPLSVLLDILEPTAGALLQLKETRQKQYVVELLQEVRGRLSALSDRDVKELERRDLDKIYATLSSLLFWETKDALTMILRVAVQLLRCAYIKKKLLGLAVVKDMLPKSPKEAAVQRDRILLEQKDPRALLQQLSSEGVLQAILGENAHSELLRKVEDLLRFLVDYDHLELKDLELLWKCGNEKHEDIMRAALSLLANA